MADMVQEFSAVTPSNEIMNYEIDMTAAIVTKMNEGSSLIIIQKFIIFFNQEFQFASRASQYCQPSWFSSDRIWLFDSQAKKSPLPRTSSSSGRDESHAPQVYFPYHD